MSLPRLGRRPALPSWPVVRRRLIVALILLAALVAGYLLWLRDSSLVAVERVEVTGAGVDPGVVAKLSDAASGLSTLHLDRAQIEAAVADEPTVLGLEMATDFPHGLTIEVRSRRPAAYVADEGGVVVAGDGVVLASGVERPEGLPVIDVEEPQLGERASGPALAAARVLGAVPRPLVPEVESAGVDSEHGAVVTLTGGIELRFGDPQRAEEKWRAAAAVLADPDLTEAVYIDVSAPSRPVVG